MRLEQAIQRKGFAAIIGCILANVVDGYDVLSIAFAGSAIAQEWSLSPAALGTLFSAGLAGMTLGSLFISPLADRYGRRPVSLACMGAMTLGMLAAALAQDLAQLLAARVFTGLGIGGVLATLNTVVAEVSPPHRRNTMLAIFSAGYPLGSVLGGLLAIGLIEDHGWQIVFTLGAVLTAAVLAVNFFTLPESSTPAGRSRIFSRSFFSALFGAERRAPTLIFCLAFFLNMVAFYFILNWTPRLVEQLGFSANTGNAVTVALNAGSLIGPLIFGLLADRLGLVRVARAYFLLFAVSIVTLGLVGVSLPLLYAAALLAGLAMAGAMTSLYALAPVIFPGSVRAAGTGLAIGVGRLGATLGPALAGWMIAAGVTRLSLHAAFAVPVAMVFLVIAMTVRRGDPQAAAQAGGFK